MDVDNKESPRTVETKAIVGMKELERDSIFRLVSTGYSLL